VIIADMRSSMVAAETAAAIACAHDFGLDSCSRREQLSGGVASTPLNVARKRLTRPARIYFGAQRLSILEQG
jgi:hypothetical protein